MKQKFTFLLMLFSFLCVIHSQAQPLCPTHFPHKMNANMVHFREDMRKLWEDHITWTRNVICNILDDLPGTTEAVNRLLQNQDDIGNAIKPYYGNAAGDALTGLLYGHITIAASLLTALNNNDNTGVATYSQQWIENADSIAMFLASANPHWDFAELQMMMHEHLDLTTAEAVARHSQDFVGDVNAYEDVHIAILEMADMLSCGIIRQFWWQFLGNNREANPEVTLSDSDISLDQNDPNPFTDFTEINYYIPEYSNDAKMFFYNSYGALIKSIDLTEKGEGSVHVNAMNLRSGIYTYYIIADGVTSEIRKMVR